MARHRSGYPTTFVLLMSLLLIGSLGCKITDLKFEVKRASLPSDDLWQAMTNVDIHLP